MARITLMPKRNGTYALTVRYLPKDQSLAFNMQVRGENGITTDEVDLYAPNNGLDVLDVLEKQIVAYRREAEGCPQPAWTDYDFVVSMLTEELLAKEDRFDRLANRQELLANLQRADGENLRRRLVAELEKKQEEEVGEDLCPKCFVPWGARMVTRHGGGCYWSEVEAEGCPECGREKD